MGDRDDLRDGRLFVGIESKSREKCDVESRAKDQGDCQDSKIFSSHAKKNTLLDKN